MTNLDTQIDEIYKAVRNNSRVILYTDPIGRPDEDGHREWSHRDDLWAISTSELDRIRTLITEARIDELEIVSHGETCVFHQAQGMQGDGFNCICKHPYTKKRIEERIAQLKQPQNTEEQ